MRAKSDSVDNVATVQRPQYLSTFEFALLFRMRPESARQALCDKGHVNGIRPIKLPNRRLLWPSDEVFALLEARNGGASK